MNRKTHNRASLRCTGWFNGVAKKLTGQKTSRRAAEGNNIYIENLLAKMPTFPHLATGQRCIYSDSFGMHSIYWRTQISGAEMDDTSCELFIAGLLVILNECAGSYDAGGMAEIVCASCQLLREGYAQVAGLGAWRAIV